MSRVVLLGMLVLGVGLGCASKASKEAAGPMAAPPAGKDAPQPAQKPVPRKIVYTADVEVIVDDLDKAEGELLRLLKDRDGYVARSDVQGEPGAPRSGTWTVRVPAEKFASFLKEVSGLGEARRTKLDSQDVTDSYYDTKANIKTFQVEEEGLQKLYLQKSAASKLDELVTLRREMRDIRREVERMQAQVQRWDKDVAFSTATVTLRDRKDYRPPLVPDFGSSLGRTFQGSVEALLAVAKFLVLAAVALVPWLVVLAVVGVPAALVLRRRRQAPPKPPDAAPSGG
jgi:hypothetical protein